MNLAAPTFFPNALLIQINNSLATRQIRPKGVGAHEVFQTVFGYADDDEAMTRHRLMSTNLVGPAGFVSMEDGEAIEVVQKATRSAARRQRDRRDGRPRPLARPRPPRHRDPDPRLLVLLGRADGRRAGGRDPLKPRARSQRNSDGA